MRSRYCSSPSNKWGNKKITCLFLHLPYHIYTKCTMMEQRRYNLNKLFHWRKEWMGGTYWSQVQTDSKIALCVILWKPPCLNLVVIKSLVLCSCLLFSQWLLDLPSVGVEEIITHPLFSWCHLNWAFGNMFTPWRLYNFCSSVSSHGSPKYLKTSNLNSSSDFSITYKFKNYFFSRNSGFFGLSSYFIWWYSIFNILPGFWSICL